MGPNLNRTIPYDLQSVLALAIGNPEGRWSCDVDSRHESHGPLPQAILFPDSLLGLTPIT